MNSTPRIEGLAETIKIAGDMYNRTRLRPFVAAFFRRILKWRR